jgi:hypothetical protein
MSAWDNTRHVTPFRSRAVEKIQYYHEFADPSCVDHLEPKRVYLWVVRKGVLHVCMRFHHRYGTKHTDLSKMKKCQAGGEIKVTKNHVYINVKSGSFRNQDANTKFILKEYLEGQPKPVILLPCIAMQEG